MVNSYHIGSLLQRCNGYHKYNTGIKFKGSFYIFLTLNPELNVVQHVTDYIMIVFAHFIDKFYDVLFSVCLTSLQVSM